MTRTRLSSVPRQGPGASFLDEYREKMLADLREELPTEAELRLKFVDVLTEGDAFEQFCRRPLRKRKNKPTKRQLLRRWELALLRFERFATNHEQTWRHFGWVPCTRPQLLAYWAKVDGVFK